MKKILFLIILFLSLFGIYKAFDNPKLNYISIGDSLINGINPYNNTGYGYNDYYEYVMNLLFDFVKDMNTVEIDGDILKLDGESYRVNLDWNFFDTKNVVH